MKTYKAYLKQEGGCDYTIGCGFRVIDIAANSMDEAKKVLTQTIAEDYSDEESKLDIAELYEVEQVFMIDAKAIYKQMEDREEAKRQQDEEERERKEFDRLKAKFGE